MAGEVGKQLIVLWDGAAGGCVNPGTFCSLTRRANSLVRKPGINASGFIFNSVMFITTVYNFILKLMTITTGWLFHVLFFSSTRTTARKIK